MKTKTRDVEGLEWARAIAAKRSGRAGRVEVAWQGLGCRCRAPGGCCRAGRDAEAAEQAWPKSGMWTL